MPKFATLWFVDKGPLSPQWQEVYSFRSDSFPKPSLIKTSNLPDEKPFSSTFLDDGYLRLYIEHDHLPDAPPLWYTLITDDKSHLKTLTLIAFTTDHYEEGTVVPLNEVKKTGLAPSERTAAINWGLDDPKLYQLYVDENFRRRRIGTKIINACDIIQVARGVGGFIYGGDQVTELGNQYGQAWVGSTRRQEPKMSMPDMD